MNKKELMHVFAAHMGLTYRKEPNDDFPRMRTRLRKEHREPSFADRMADDWLVCEAQRRGLEWRLSALKGKHKRYYWPGDDLETKS